MVIPAEVPLSSDLIGISGAEKIESPRERVAHAADPGVIELPDADGGVASP
jgi:hypothetical protein